MAGGKIIYNVINEADCKKKKPALIEIQNFDMRFCLGPFALVEIYLFLTVL